MTISYKDWAWSCLSREAKRLSLDRMVMEWDLILMGEFCGCPECRDSLKSIISALRGATEPHVVAFREELISRLPE